MKIAVLIFVLIASKLSLAQQSGDNKKIMDGFPASRESQVSFQNYRDYPYNKWSFHNMGAPMHTLMIPRGGAIHQYKSSNNSSGQTLIPTGNGGSETFENLFANNEADGVIVLRNNTILFEKYWNGLTRDYQHIWFIAFASVVINMMEKIIGFILLP